MDKEQALHSFWSGFIKSYDESSVPENAVMPYMTYEVITDSFGNEVAVTNSLWYNSTSWAGVTQKAQEIANALGLGGVLRQYNDGAMWIKRGTPFAQRMPDENDTVKRIVLNFNIEYISQN